MPTQRLCSIADCSKQTYCRGLCRNHYSSLWAKPFGQRCSLRGCDKPHYSHSWCVMHYKRWQNTGHPLDTYGKKGACLRYLNEVVLPYRGKDCLQWPFPRSPERYATIQIKGTNHLVHRLACQRIHGPPPTDKHHAAHSCGKGRQGCVNPQHLSWKTPAANNADKILHGVTSRGSKNGSAKLTDDNVLDIRALKEKMLQREIAKMFGVTKSLIGQIHAGKIWGWL